MHPFRQLILFLCPLVVLWSAQGAIAAPKEITPITISGALPGAISDAVVDYTITMPGFILEHGQATTSPARSRGRANRSSQAAQPKDRCSGCTFQSS
jgi:hypothetical protein